MPKKKMAKVLVREWLETPSERRIPKVAIMQKAHIKDVRTLNNYIEAIQSENGGEPDDYNPEEYLIGKYKNIDAALIRACEKGNATALKTFYQLTNRLVERSENLNIELSGDELTRQNLEAERQLREAGYRVEEV